MPRLRDLQSRDLLVQLLIFVLIQLIQLKSSMRFTEPLSNKRWHLIASLQKDYI